MSDLILFKIGILILSRTHTYYNTFCKNKEVLDFGCGWGGFLSNIKKAKSYSAVELRKECISYIKKNKKKIKI